MPFHLTTTIAQALQEIEFTGEQKTFSIHETEQLRPDDVLNAYGAAKWSIIDFLNQHYQQNFDLYHWLQENKEDEVAYFLNEAGSNCLTHSQYKAPSRFQLWLGKKGFIIGMEQKGKGFNVEKARSAAGGFFTFFEQSKSVVFFDDAEKAKTTFIQVFLALDSH
ncbi:MAG: hypothetical protein AABX13_04240 [Nanoarchaeota archaeon]